MELNDVTIERKQTASENKGTAKLSKNLRGWARHLEMRGIKRIEIARALDVEPSTITKLLDGKTWKHD